MTSDDDQPLAAVVLDALAGEDDGSLARAVGPGAAQRLRRELRARSRRWVAALAPGRAFEATTPTAALIALDGHRGAVVLVAPDIPSLGAAHAASVRSDLEHGAGIIVGSAHDARPYLVALRDPAGGLLERVADGFEALAGAAGVHDAALAMIRHERRLASAADARALALDPLAAPELLAELGFLRPGVRNAARSGTTVA